MYDENVEATDEEKAGTFSSKDESIAKVSEVGKIEAVKEGKTVVIYTTTLGKLIASITVYVHESLSDIQRDYVKVNDINTIEVGDELIFACPDFGVAASLDIKDGYVIPTNISFKESNTKISSYGDDVAEFYVGPSAKDELAITLETQENAYLSGRNTEGGRKLRYSSNGKDQINWIIEVPEGYSDYFIVSYDIQTNYWLMFNKINGSDIRFNLYDSNETALMKKPTIYRKTIIR